MKTDQMLDAVYVLALSELIDARAERIKNWVEENKRLLPGSDDLLTDLAEIIARNSMIRSISEFAFTAPEKTDQLEIAL